MGTIRTPLKESQAEKWYQKKTSNRLPKKKKESSTNK